MPKIAGHQGRIVKLTGDGMLVEFPSVVNAVECAAEIQREMRERNVDVPEDRRIEFRIGINLGDVIVEDDDIFGDGVNVAARLESIARAGRHRGVSVGAREHSATGSTSIFEDMGEQRLKNIERPVRVYNVLLDSALAMLRRHGRELRSLHGTKAVDRGPAFHQHERRSRAGIFRRRHHRGHHHRSSQGYRPVGDRPQLGLHLQGQGRRSRRRSARELGVGYLLEGSVRKAGQRVRITAQLIDGRDGRHLWADRYDRDLTDIFAIQDEITKTIVEQLKVKLLPEEKKAIEQAPTGNVEAYTYYLRGRQFVLTRTKSSIMLGRRMFAKAVELDPLYARAYAGMAICDSLLKSSFGIKTAVEGLLATTEKALALDSSLAEAHSARGVALAVSERRAEARLAFERAVELDPSSFEVHYFFARFCFTEGDFEQSAELFLRAIEIEPDNYYCPLHLHNVYEALGRLEESHKYARIGIEKAELALALHPESSALPNWARRRSPPSAKSIGRRTGWLVH